MSTGETWIPGSVLRFKGLVTTGSVSTGGATTSDNLRDGTWSFKITIPSLLLPSKIAEFV